MLETFKSFLQIAMQLTILLISVSFLLSFLQAYIPYDKIEKTFKRIQSSDWRGHCIILCLHYTILFLFNYTGYC